MQISICQHTRLYTRMTCLDQTFTECMCTYMYVYVYISYGKIIGHGVEVCSGVYIYIHIYIYIYIYIFMRVVRKPWVICVTKKHVNPQGLLSYILHPIPSRVQHYASLNTSTNQHV